MMTHLGGPETPEPLESRQYRYEEMKRQAGPTRAAHSRSSTLRLEQASAGSDTGRASGEARTSTRRVGRCSRRTRGAAWQRLPPRRRSSWRALATRARP